ncbi:hypothetical protein GCM10023322_41910 [Rugosimonospora acidiphila]|uniref:Secreted protein n=1 Tax=Rugosimonospora acidiphila TaxID=556531 RepID=A0ABP9S0C6_9ACTN
MCATTTFMVLQASDAYGLAAVSGSGAACSPALSVYGVVWLRPGAVSGPVCFRACLPVPVVNLS